MTAGRDADPSRSRGPLARARVCSRRERGERDRGDGGERGGDGRAGEHVSRARVLAAHRRDELVGRVAYLLTRPRFVGIDVVGRLVVREARARLLVHTIREPREPQPRDERAPGGDDGHETACDSEAGQDATAAIRVRPICFSLYPAWLSARSKRDAPRYERVDHFLQTLVGRRGLQHADALVGRAQVPVVARGLEALQRRDGASPMVERGETGRRRARARANRQVNRAHRVIDDGLLEQRLADLVMEPPLLVHELRREQLQTRFEGGGGLSVSVCFAELESLLVARARGRARGGSRRSALAPGLGARATRVQSCDAERGPQRQERRGASSRRGERSGLEVIVYGATSHRVITPAVDGLGEPALGSCICDFRTHGDLHEVLVVASRLTRSSGRSMSRVNSPQLERLRSLRGWQRSRGAPSDVDRTPSLVRSASELDWTHSRPRLDEQGVDETMGAASATRMKDSSRAHAAHRDPCGVRDTLIADGRYLVRELLGMGGMGAVYRATDTKLSLDVAIKFIRREGQLRRSARRRFEREIKLISRIRHPHVATVTDRGEHRGLMFYVMELCDGEDLRALLRDGPLPWRHVRDVASQVLDALQVAHDRGIIHRDIKPQNCVARAKRDGSLYIKVLDFGVAKVAQEHGRGPLETKITHTGALVGTPAYMSGQLLRGMEADARSDLYALGVMLYELLTRQVPSWRGYNVTTERLRSTKYPPALSETLPSVSFSVEVERFIRTLLAPEPGDRFASATEALKALERTPREQQLSAVVAATRRRVAPRVAQVGASLLVIVSGAILVGALERREAVWRPTRVSLSAEDSQPTASLRLASLWREVSAALPGQATVGDRVDDEQSDAPALETPAPSTTEPSLPTPAVEDTRTETRTRAKTPTRRTTHERRALAPKRDHANADALERAVRDALAEKQVASCLAASAEFPPVPVEATVRCDRGHPRIKISTASASASGGEFRECVAKRLKKLLDCSQYPNSPRVKLAHEIGQ